MTEEGVVSTLKVDSVDRRDSSLFTCTASNGFGSDDTNMQVIVQGKFNQGLTCVEYRSSSFTEKPDAPSKASIVKVESRSIAVTWSAPYSGNSPILHYVVEVKEVTDEWDHAKLTRVPGTDTQASVGGLWPGTAYHVRLTAENGLGRSEPGPALHAITELEGGRLINGTRFVITVA